MCGVRSGAGGGGGGGATYLDLLLVLCGLLGLRLDSFLEIIEPSGDYRHETAQHGQLGRYRSWRYNALTSLGQGSP